MRLESLAHFFGFGLTIRYGSNGCLGGLASDGNGGEGEGESHDA